MTSWELEEEMLKNTAERGNRRSMAKEERVRK
jgi:hypothetical protein